jgi:CRISPR-associated protein Csb2
MPTILKISVRFLLDEFDGRGDGGEPEWPPSPLRLFQTLTNSAARLGMADFAPVLEHLETLPPPTIFASIPAKIQPSPEARFRVTSYVPNNDGDLWFDKADKSGGKRVEKNLFPTRLPENAVVAYSWEISHTSPPGFLDHIRQLTRAISAFGWGVNLVVADATFSEVEDNTNEGSDTENWLPAEDGVTPLRIPIRGTLSALENRHKAFLARLPTAPDGSQFFRPVPPLEQFRVLTYRRATDPVRPPFAVFALRQLDDSGFRAFDPVLRGLHVSAMLRHVAGGADIARSLGWKDAQIARLVHGHTDEESANTSAARLLFLPLPSIEARGEGKARVVGAIRRILVTSHGPMNRDEFQRLAERLDGMELIDEKDGKSTALLSRLPDSDKLTKDNYLPLSPTWATVSPVILPGYDDPRKLRQRLRTNSGLTAEKKNALVTKLDQRIDHLLRKALRQAGYSEAIARHANIEWRGSGYWPGTDMASRYMTGDQHRRFRKLHVRIHFRNEDGHAISMPGPLCFGGGKFSGTGLFAALP